MASAKSVAAEKPCGEEGDWIARQLLSPEDFQRSPEEYAARHAHLIGSFSLHCYQYRDAALGEWARRLGAILSSEDEIERCRRQFLDPQELATVQRQEVEGF